MKVIDVIAAILLVIGGLNWGLGVFDINLVTELFGAGTPITKTVYGLVGLAAIWQIFQWKAIQCRWHCSCGCNGNCKCNINTKKDV